MVRWNKKAWNKIYRKEEKIVTTVHEDVPKIVRFFKKKGVKKILDLGCGTGRHLRYLTKHGFDVYGIDISSYGIKTAKKFLEKENLKSHLKVGDIYKKLPYGDNFFDAIVSIKTMHHGKIENIRRLIKEIERILKSNGLIFITVTKRKPKKMIPKEKLWKIKFIAPRTFIPLTSEEKGLIHYWFNRKLLRKSFRNFIIYNIWVDFEHHYALFGELKRKL
ncbi:MAG: class I SAM-dependent methyltransferase [Candidatus Aenigmarchaeota archaeon]|nr:class I SAM-dependent methyltransferase [Candidatus Aenigmarchaeota archaeon]